MHYFHFKGNTLYCENARVSDIARRFGTPLYVYSQRTMVEHFRKLARAFRELSPLICYSVKANSNLSILRLLLAEGAGLDIVSGGELYRAQKVSCPGEKIVYASVGKTETEIKEAIGYGILMFNVESRPELARINAVAGALGRKASVALRFNPDVAAGTHAYITTGTKENKFGMDARTCSEIFLNRRQYPSVDLAGIHMHIGSQITAAAPFLKAIRQARRLLKELKQQGVKLRYLNIGGGLGIVYDKETPQTADVFAGKVAPLLKGLPLKIILEPGRFIVGNAGILVSRVVYVKEGFRRKFVIVDAAMNDLLRPSLYGAYHAIEPVIKTVRPKPKTAPLADVVGPICESSDFLGKDRALDVSADDLLAVFGCGAYGFSMSSNYNSRLAAAEVLVNGSKTTLIRRRQAYADLIQTERTGAN